MMDCRGKKAISSVLDQCSHKEYRPIKAIIQNVPPLPAERMNGTKVSKMISLDGIGAYEIRKCWVCHYNSIR